MKLVVIIFTFLLSFTLFSQNTIIVKGVIKGEDGKRVANASVFIPEINKGTTSNKKGEFVFKLKSEVLTLFISHLNYYPKTITINKYSEEKIDTLKIDVILKEKINVLSSFEVSAEKIELLYKSSFVTILDYQFYENKLLLLLKENSTIKLKLLNLNQEEENFILAPKNANTLRKDCFGNIHILNKDSAYQLLIDGINLSILYKITRNKYEVYLKPCVNNVKNTFIFKQEDKRIHTVVYYYFDDKKKIIPLKKIRDGVAEIYASAINNTMRMISNPGVSKMAESKSSVRAARSLNVDIAYLNLLLKKLADNPLFVIKDNVYVFDHPKNTCWVYDENLLYKRTFSLDYKDQKKWKNKLIQDEEQEDVYAKFVKGGIVYLKKIDLQTGKIIASFRLDKHTFPTKIKIKNNTAYYLYQDHFNHGQMSLYKQGLY